MYKYLKGPNAEVVDFAISRDAHFVYICHAL